MNFRALPSMKSSPRSASIHGVVQLLLISAIWCRPFNWLLFGAAGRLAGKRLFDQYGGDGAVASLWGDHGVARAPPKLWGLVTIL